MNPIILIAQGVIVGGAIALLTLAGLAVLVGFVVLKVLEIPR